MNTKRKRTVTAKTGKTVITAVITAIVLVALMVGGIFLLVAKLLEPASTVTNGFLEHIRDEDYETAFDLLSTGLKIQVEDANRLAILIEEFDAKPESWWFHNQSVRNNYGRFVGDVILANGNSIPITILLELNADHLWQITHFEWGSFSSNDL